MQRLTHRGISSLLLALPLACSSNASDGSASGTTPDEGFFTDDDARSVVPGSEATLTAAPFTFPGAGTSQAAKPLVVGLGPETSDECNPSPVAGAAATIDDVQTVCFYGESEPNVPAAAIEQVVEVVGNDEWVHVRLLLNPDFVDNTYGANAIGWGENGTQRSEPAPAPPPRPDAADAGAPAAADAGAPPPASGDAPPPARRDPRERGEVGRPGRGGHSFRDLVGSDHAEMQLLDAVGSVVVQFKLDYLTASDAAASGFESLSVSGGEGKLIVGDAAVVLASTTAMDRNLEACGLADFTVDSPATDAAYTPNPAAPEWDYRVSYEVWVAAGAFGSAGFGSALIELVHASPSKLAGDSVDVRPAPCPLDPNNPELEPEPLPPVLSNLR